MPSEAVTEPQGRLQVHSTTPFRLASQRGALQGLFTDVRPKPIPDTLGNREADPVHRNAVPQVQGAEGASALNQETAPPALNPTHCLDQPCEHG